MKKEKKMEINSLFFKVTYKLHCIKSYPFKYRTSCFKKVSSICDFIPTHGSKLMCDFGSGMQIYQMQRFLRLEVKNIVEN